MACINGEGTHEIFHSRQFFFSFLNEALDFGKPS